MNWNVHWKHIGHRSGKIILPATQNQILRSTAKNIYEHIFIWAFTDRNNVNLALREKLEFSASLNYRNLPFERCRIKNQLYAEMSLRDSEHWSQLIRIDLIIDGMTTRFCFTRQKQQQYVDAILLFSVVLSVKY